MTFYNAKFVLFHLLKLVSEPIRIFIRIENGPINIGLVTFLNIQNADS